MIFLRKLQQIIHFHVLRKLDLSRSHHTDRLKRGLISKNSTHAESRLITIVIQGTCCPLGYERVYLPLCQVADTPFHFQGDMFCAMFGIYGIGSIIYHMN